LLSYSLNDGSSADARAAAHHQREPSPVAEQVTRSSGKPRSDKWLLKLREGTMKERRISWVRDDVILSTP